MAVSIAAAIVMGDFFAEGSDLWSLPWGKVTLIGLYVSLVFFGAWIAYRENSWVSALAWWAGLVVLGSLAAATYLAMASFRSEDPVELLIGEKRE